ncbi:hypothetical protein G7046_g4697 [Stylonectria norvegica]|nr:hypothetical protein G7046_g4697 [Stylonectria norvegica]
MSLMRISRRPGLGRRGFQLVCHGRAMSSATSSERTPRAPDAPFRMAVVGSGPAGFYTSYRVMNRIAGARVDMYESLPVPFGLVRYGVAPDHPEVKNCRDKFDEIAASPRFTFLGNISIGRPGHSSQHATVELKSLMRNYDAVLFAYGASEDKKLGISGESNLGGIYSAREFVGWYNGLPDCADLEIDLTRGEEAVVIGQGNVALDVARMLLEDIDVLRKTDMTEQALAKLAQSRIKRVHVVGRRGPMQAAFTIKEVRELMKLSDVAFLPFQRSLIPDDLKSLPRASRRLTEVLVKGSPTPAEGASKAWSLDSCLSPKHFLGNESSPSNVASTAFDVTELSSPFDPKSPAKPTGATVILPSDVVFRSVGYKSASLPGFSEAGIQFDEGRGIVSNDGLGRVTRLVSDRHAGGVENQRVPGAYCAGWVKTGPTGVIASTMQDSFITGDAIAEDWLSGASFTGSTSGHQASGWEGVKSEPGSSVSKAVAWDDWRRIDQAERDRGRSMGKDREKFTSTAEMLAVLG